MVNFIAAEAVAHKVDGIHWLGDEEVGLERMRRTQKTGKRHFIIMVAEGVSGVDGCCVDGLFSKHLIHNGAHGHNQLHVAGRTGTRVEVGG